MSNLIEPKPVKIVYSVIFSSKADSVYLKNRLTMEFGELDYESEPVHFDKTNYYTDEMGGGLYRIILSKKELKKREKIVDNKTAADRIERETSIDNKRIYNIDPGYMASEHFVLSTGKGYAHRPYLGKGVYADLTLIFKDKNFSDLEWTYPDYKTEEIKNILTEIRKIYLDNLREGNFYD